VPLLHFAVGLGLKQGLQFLTLGNVANIEAARSSSGSAPLDTAARFGRTDVVRLLWEKGANIEPMRSDDGSAALHNASWRGYVGVVTLLLEKVQILRSRECSTTRRSKVSTDRGRAGVIGEWCGHTCYE